MPNGDLPTAENDGDITYFAQSDYRNKNTMFGIRRADRSRHTYVIGKTGMGKSTMLSNMAIQDIQNGNGLCVIDPHGELADSLLDYVPENRVEDVMYFAPFDLEHPISFNVLEDVGADQRHLVADGLLSAFKKIWVDMWSGRMEYLLNNALLALMEYPDATLLGVNRMFADKRYRVRVVQNVTDASVKAFWEDEYANYDQNFARQAAAAIQNKVGQFVSNPLVRNIIGQTTSSFDVRKLMDEKKIMLVNLSKGRVGEDSARLIGSMLITKMYLSAMSRADATRRNLSTLPQFYFYVDEFQSFANESFAGILSEARKYKLNLTIAHQYIEQMDEEVRNAVFGNVGTMVAFRVGAYDAEVLEKEFQPTFTQEDLVNLGFAQIYLKLMIGGVSSKPFSARTLPPIPEPDHSFRDAIINYSQKTYGQPRKKVEADVEKWYDSTYGIIDDEEARNMAEQQRKEREGDDGGSDSGSKDKSPKKRERMIGGSPKKESKAKKKDDSSDQEHREAINVRLVDSKKSESKKNEVPTASLKDLDKASKQEMKKKASKKNKSALKNALSNVLSSGESNLDEDLGDEIEREDEEKGKEKEEVSKKEPKKDSSDEDRDKEFDKIADETPQEIPEDVLRDMLKVEEEERQEDNKETEKERT